MEKMLHSLQRLELGSEDGTRESHPRVKELRERLHKPRALCAEKETMPSGFCFVLFCHWRVNLGPFGEAGLFSTVCASPQDRSAARADPAVMN